MEERLVILAIIGALAVAVTLGVRWWAARRLRNLVAGDAASLWAALGARPDGRPTIVAFSTPSCAACHHAQGPALTTLRTNLGDRLRVLGVDASRQPDIARAFGVLTVPSTAVLAGDGRLTTINHGFAPAHYLLQQIHT